MPDTSPNLGLPYILPAQAQKHVTHNEAIERLDALTQLAVIDADRTAPPPSPAEGDRHIVAGGATGDWAGQDGAVALRAGGGWLFLAPRAGWCAEILSDGITVSHDGLSWATKAPNLSGAALQNLTGLGVNATADGSNPLTSSGPGTLLTHGGADHRLTVNKAGTADTAALLFQSSWTGHAEMGLAGETAFSIKVSADGSTWSTALTADAAAGEVRMDLPLGGSAVQATATDAGAGKVMTVGAFGLGSTSAPALADLDATGTPTGHYAIDSGTSGVRPDGVGPDGFVTVEAADGTHLSQTYWDAAVDGTWTRRHRASGWTLWQRLHAETGTEASGDYVRLGAGLQMCWAGNLTTAGTTSPVGSLFAAAPVTWTFPTPFAAPPVVTATASGGDRFASIVSVSATDVTVRVHGATLDATAGTVHLTAMGQQA